MYQEKIKTGITQVVPWTLALACSAPAAAFAQSENTVALDQLVVTGTRTETSLSEIARSVTVVTSEQIEEQARISKNIGDILAQTVPGLAPSTEALSNFGQTLRGRKFLVLIDGIPQSTPLRDASRGLNTISPAAIERIEVVRGGTAVYGFGASGGVINIITRKAADEPVEVYSQAGTSFSTEHFDDSVDYETEHRVSGSRENWDYVLSGFFTDRGQRFDADGNRRPPDPLGTQGGLADTTEYNLLGKTGFDFDGGRQRVEFMINAFDNEQDTDFTFGQTLEDGRTPAIPLAEAPADSTPVVNPGQQNTTARVSYSHAELAGSSLDAQLYYGDLTQVFPKFPGFPQGEIASEKYGLRTTVATPVDAITTGARITWGGDYLRDETATRSFDGDTGTPAMDQDALAAFAELEIPVGNWLMLRGGVRHEEIEVDTATLASNRFGNTIRGGTLNFSETLLNAGAVFFVGDSVDLFASFSQGFTIGDLGRVLSDAGPFGAGLTLDAEDFESEAEKVDNYEIGARYSGDRLQATAAVFFSESDNGTTFDDDLRIQKFKEDVWGVEATADYRLADGLTVGSSASWQEGEREDADGSETDLDGTRIAPLKLTAYVEQQTTARWRNRLQVLHVGSRDEFPDASGPDDFASFGQGEVNSYTVVNAVSRFRAGPGSVTVAAQNLLNEDYFPVINQAFNIPSARTKGGGRRLSVGYEMVW
ncbi:TonB-dependent receptor [Marinobacter sp.]|uniref:TonB-dependent receptor n=1 Tax=Marinobacter sp. TaxID=50741 RepID=UPI002B482276|nr:TonB-dependent receptor [Marinobacter sp.]HKK56098.1 TonB-dependent receptor [Marinobacter sp.]